MKLNASPIAVVALCFLASLAHADPAPWSYNWTPSTFDLLATSGNGKVTFNAATGSGAGNSDIVAANLDVFSDATPDSPATFTNVGYSLTLHLTDDQSLESGTLTFSGRLNGNLSSLGVDLNNTFDGETSQELTLGGRLYHVDIGPYSAPGVPGSPNHGAIGATLTVSDVPGQGPNPPPVQDAPEPSTLLLAGLGISSATLAWWRRGQRQNPLQAA